MILANWPRRASEEPHSSTAPSRLVEAYFLFWSVSMSSDAPYWRPPSRALSMCLSVGVTVPKPVFWILYGLPTTCPESVKAITRDCPLSGSRVQKGTGIAFHGCLTPCHQRLTTALNGRRVAPVFNGKVSWRIIYENSSTRRALQPAHAAQESRLHGSCRDDTGSGNCQRNCHLQRCGYSPAASFALRRIRSHPERQSVGAQDGSRRRSCLSRRLSGLGCAERCFQLHGGVARLAGEHHWRRPSSAGSRNDDKW